MRQITFELLRHGPPNNQLLSPLTQYLALCENHPASTLQLPFEHNAMLYRLRALRYQEGNASRVFQVDDTARVLADLLGGVPGLVAELNRDNGSGAPHTPHATEGTGKLTHLRMMLSASELALLPFELALSPPGFPGAGQPLLLQTQSPICITREVRRVTEPAPSWPATPRVLYIAAQPEGVAPIPFELHLKALERLLDPWVDFADSEEDRAAKLAEHLMVLPDASCDMIARTCAEHSFSHVHILAHGVEYSTGYDVRFGLALHDPRDPTGPADPVSGERLASALRAVQSGAGQRLARPLAVSIASCDSGNQGGVAGVGGSIAFALHQAEIPIVIASQFPLSIPASLIAVEVLMEALLWGRDPRLALNDLRRRLHARFPDTHDWASMTAYVALPASFEQWLRGFRIHQTRRSMASAMKYADRATEQLAARWMPTGTPDRPSGDLQSTSRTQLVAAARQRTEAGRKRLEALHLEHVEDGALAGQLAATEKRCAQVYYYFGRARSAEADLAAPCPDWAGLLNQARRHYWQAFTAAPENGWALVQFLSLDVVLRRLRTPRSDLALEPIEEHNAPAALWSLAHTQSLNDLRSRDEQSKRWALASLLELYLLALLPGLAPEATDASALERRAHDAARNLVILAGPNAFDVYSTRSQMLRYADWYATIAVLDPMRPAVDGIVEGLPAVLPTGQA